MARAAPTQAGPRAGTPRRRASARVRGRVRRRRIAAIVLVAIAGGSLGAAIAGLGPLGDAVQEITLPLKHEDIIRQQAADKGLDPALIAAVIHQESRFRDQTSVAGARGLMQITPATADFIAEDSGGTAFTEADLATPQVNISYGAYYLRYLLERYEDDVPLTLAAYNAGETNLNRWIAEAGGVEEFDTADDVPFPETRAYVANVTERRDQYAERYAEELGL